MTAKSVLSNQTLALLSKTETINQAIQYRICPIFEVILTYQLQNLAVNDLFSTTYDWYKRKALPDTFRSNLFFASADLNSGLIEGFSFDNFECVAFTSPISSTVCGLLIRIERIKNVICFGILSNTWHQEHRNPCQGIHWFPLNVPSQPCAAQRGASQIYDLDGHQQPDTHNH